MILGYVEEKAIGANLGQVLKSDQIESYQRIINQHPGHGLSGIYLGQRKGKGPRGLAFLTTSRAREQSRRGCVEASDAAHGFFSTAPEGSAGPSNWRWRSPRAAICCATFSLEELERQESEHQEGRLYGLFQVFRDKCFTS